MTAPAFVVRRDIRPLTKETIETMYHFCVSLELNSYEDKDGVHRLSIRLTSTDFRECSEKHWTEATKLEQGRYRCPSSFIHQVFTEVDQT